MAKKKLLMANFPWIGGIANYLEDAFKDLGFEVNQIFYEEKLMKYLRLIKLNQIKIIDRKFLEKERDNYNKKITELADTYKPDVFLTFNEAHVNTSTVRFLKENIKAINICLIGDDPFDSYRFKELPYSLRYFTHIYVAEKEWIPKIKMVAGNTEIIKFSSAYDHNKFNLSAVPKKNLEFESKLNCEVSFTGESYTTRAEGGYRSAILSNLTNYELRIWGDDGWKYQFKFYPDLAKCYKGNRLPFDELIYLYANSQINLNMPSPQLLTAFQPRVFEIPAIGGFQIVDYREDLFEFFDENEIVTFQSVIELKDKVDFYLKNPEKRKPFIDAGFRRIAGNTWKDRASEITKNMEQRI